MNLQGYKKITNQVPKTSCLANPSLDLLLLIIPARQNKTIKKKKTKEEVRISLTLSLAK